MQRTGRCLNSPKGPQQIPLERKPQGLPEWARQVSQSPEGATLNFHLIKTLKIIEDERAMSQSPEGSTLSFHEQCNPRIIRPAVARCLNPPKGPR